MKIERILITNFRRLEAASIPIEDKETIFVGPNNSGKTSATAIFRCFLGDRQFRFHDFSVSKLAAFDEFGVNGDESILPEITLDIWMKIDPDSIEFGRTFSLLPNLAEDFTKLGVRLSFKTSDPIALRQAYLTAYPPVNQEAPTKSLSQYLSQEGILARNFSITYSSLEDNAGAITATPLDSRDGKALLKSLIRVDFVDAQRNIDDIEGSRSNRLSSAFANFYQKNLEQAEIAAEAHQVIDENNERLSAHYKDQFAGLMTIIKGLGVPSINDRDLKIVSTREFSC